MRRNDKIPMGECSYGFTGNTVKKLCKNIRLYEQQNENDGSLPLTSPTLPPWSSWIANCETECKQTMCDFSKNSLSKVLQNFLSIFKMSQVFVKF